jgi:signal transduction histidine kinase/CheY-like chemotaxis protein
MGVSLVVALGEGVGDVVGGLLVSSCPTSWRRQSDSTRKEAELWAVALGVTVASSLVVAGIALGVGSTAALAPRLLARLTGLACLGPLLRVAQGRALDWRRHLGSEGRGLGMLLVGTTLAAGLGPRGPSGLALVFALTLPLIWAGLRLSEPMPQLGILLVAVVAVASTRLGHGPFRYADTTLALQVLLSVLSLTTLLAAATTAERTRLEEELRRERDVSVKASQAKGAYLAMVSHEIRTPLGGLIGMTKALGPEVAVELRPMLDTIRRSAEGVLGILNDVLDLSKMEAGKMRLEARVCEPGQLVRDVRSLFERNAESKGVSISVEMGPQATRLIADPLRLRQVLSNLVSNAVKFTPRGGQVVIRTRLDEGDEQFPYGTFILEVADTGIGIPADRMRQLFEDFSQIHEGAGHNYGGTGLGLAISKRLIVAMGGTLTAMSCPGQGSTFTASLHLPYKEQLRATLAMETEEHLDPTMLQGCHVLLAEDNPVNRWLAIRLLERLGCSVRTVENGRQAVEAWHEGQWDIVVMDNQMPELNGLEATLLIRELEEKEHRGRTPILAMTANTQKEVGDACLAAGMDAVLTKPAESSSIQGAILRLLGRREASSRRRAGPHLSPAVEFLSTRAR